MKPMRRALEGVRILDLSRMLPGPYCSMMLADLGAEVIKIEEPKLGDPTRHSPPTIDGRSAAFAQVNRNKKSIALDRQASSSSTARAAFSIGRVFERLQELVSSVSSLVCEVSPS